MDRRCHRLPDAEEFRRQAGDDPWQRLPSRQRVAFCPIGVGSDGCHDSAMRTSAKDSIADIRTVGHCARYDLANAPYGNPCGRRIFGCLFLCWLCQRVSERPSLALAPRDVALRLSGRCRMRIALDHRSRSEAKHEEDQALEGDTGGRRLTTHSRSFSPVKLCRALPVGHRLPVRHELASAACP